MPQNENSNSETSDRDSETWDVPLEWIQQKIGRFVEMFVILQFVAGAFIFFCGIFLLMWAVVPATSLRAGSYMLLAFFIIGRALLGLFGYYTDNFCLLFSYGVLLVATFVVRTIMTLVRLKITTSPDDILTIPPLLHAAPGAQSAPIELICSVLEFSQAFCSFYMCFIIAKTETMTKKLDEENKLTNSIIIANRFMEKKEKNETDTKAEAEEVANKADQPETNEEDNKDTITSDMDKTRQNRSNSTDLLEPKQQQPKPAPLKGILHQPSTSNYKPTSFELCTTQSHQQQIPFPPNHTTSRENQNKIQFVSDPNSNTNQCTQHQTFKPQPAFNHYANVITSENRNDIPENNGHFVGSINEPNRYSNEQLIRGQIGESQLKMQNVGQYHEGYDTNNNPAWVQQYNNFNQQDNWNNSVPPPVSYHHGQVPCHSNANPYNAEYMDLSPERIPYSRPNAPSPMDIVMALSPTPQPNLEYIKSVNSPLLYNQEQQNHNHRRNRRLPRPVYPDYGSTNDYDCPENLQFPP